VVAPGTVGATVVGEFEVIDLERSDTNCATPPNEERAEPGESDQQARNLLSDQHEKYFQ